VPVDAINQPENNLILLNRSRWRAMRGEESKRQRLVFHEYLGILGIEDGNYQVSSRMKFPVSRMDIGEADELKLFSFLCSLLNNPGFCIDESVVAVQRYSDDPNTCLRRARRVSHILLVCERYVRKTDGTLYRMLLQNGGIGLQGIEMLKVICLGVGLHEDGDLTAREGLASIAQELEGDIGKCTPSIPPKYISNENWITVKECHVRAALKSTRCN
ncbi:MAG: hypothetical protein ABL958_18765, partial [Bdellovibrionia bacterium]